MSSSRRAAVPALLGLAILCLAGACQPLPRPLADVAVPGPELLNLPGRGGVAVLEPAGLPEGRARAFADALAEALRDREVQAIAGGSMSESLFLLGRIEAVPQGTAEVELVFDWELTDADGTSVARRLDHETIPRRDWERATPRWLAARAAPGVAALYNGQMPSTTTAVVRTPVYLAGVTGAPGDGGRSLPRALVSVVETRDMAVVQDRKAAVAVIEGIMTVKPVAPGKEAVEIKWRVTRPSGEEVGVVTQANEIPAGSLKGAWGEIAAAVAMGAGEGISDLVARIPKEAPAAGRR
ncbi:MAG: hypothetical protein IT561_16485 [Alphaproteobacteria bacterium]|nr:hypothetical protein [Alphaproteobacteria bacterium]